MEASDTLKCSCSAMNWQTVHPRICSSIAGIGSSNPVTPNAKEAGWDNRWMNILLQKVQILFNPGKPTGSKLPRVLFFFICFLYCTLLICLWLLFIAATQNEQTKMSNYFKSSEENYCWVLQVRLKGAPQILKWAPQTQHGW